MTGPRTRRTDTCAVGENPKQKKARVLKSFMHASAPRGSCMLFFAFFLEPKNKQTQARFPARSPTTWTPIAVLWPQGSEWIMENKPR